MAQKNSYLKVLAYALILGVPALLFLGTIYDILSPREWAFGMIAWFAVLMLRATARQRAAQKNPASNVAHEIPIDDRSRKRLLWRIRTRKIWIGVLVVCLPFGIANGIAQHFYWELPVFIAINLSLIYASTVDISRLKKRLIADATSD